MSKPAQPTEALLAGYQVGELGRSSSDRRLVWLDNAKGIGIILVVFGHTVRGLRVETVGPSLDYYHLLDGWIYSFHMPLFFFISGFLFKRRSHQPWTRFFFSLTTGIVVPYVLWSIAFIVVQALSPYPVNNPLGPERLWHIWRQPVLHMWFLYALFFVQIAFFLTGKFLNTSGLTSLGGIFALCYLTHQWSVDSYVPGLTMGGAFFFFGILANGQFPDEAPQRHAAAIFFLSAALWVGTFLLKPFVPELSEIVGVFGVAMTIAFCRRLPDATTRARMLLTRLGEASIAIYVSHTIFSAATRLILNQAHIRNCHVHIVAGTIVGLAIPTVLYFATVRLGIVPFVGFGQQPRLQTGSNKLS